MQDRFAEALIAALPRLRRFALSLARSADVADDLVQTAAERAFAARDRFDPATSLDAWLFRILRNAWIDTARRSRIRGVSVEVDDRDPALATDPAPGLEARLMLGATEAAMLTLPDEQRAVLHLVCIEGLSYAEAAEVLGIPRGTVMSRLSRARLALAGKLGIDAGEAR